MRTETVNKAAISLASLDEIKDHLRIEHSSEDAYIDGLFAAAVDLVEQRYDLTIAERTVNIWLDKWPSGRLTRWWDGWRDGSLTELFQPEDRVRLPIGPVYVLEAVGVFDTTGVETLLPVQNFTLQPGLFPLLHAGAARSALLSGRAVDRIRIQVKAGFGADSNLVPAGLRQGLLMITAFLYANRGDLDGDLMAKAGVSELLAPYRRVKL